MGRDLFVPAVSPRTTMSRREWVRTECAVTAGITRMGRLRAERTVTRVAGTRTQLKALCTGRRDEAANREAVQEDL